MISQFAGSLRAAHTRFVALAAMPLAVDILALTARLALAGVFWRSLLTKVETMRLLPYAETINGHEVVRHHLRVPAFPLELKPSALVLFRDEYALPVIPPGLAAWLATLAEFVLPIALLLGLFTRLSALALLAMTLVIQIFVYPEAWWPTHIMWVAIALSLVVNGPGRISLDALAGYRARKDAALLAR